MAGNNPAPSISLSLSLSLSLAQLRQSTPSRPPTPPAPPTPPTPARQLILDDAQPSAIPTPSTRIFGGAITIIYGAVSSAIFCRPALVRNAGRRRRFTTQRRSCGSHSHELAITWSSGRRYVIGRDWTPTLVMNSATVITPSLAPIRPMDGTDPIEYISVARSISSWDGEAPSRFHS